MKKILFTLALCILISQSAFARYSMQASPSFDGIGFRFSFLAPQWYDPGFGVGIHSDFKITSIFHLYPSFEYSHAADPSRDIIWLNDGHQYYSQIYFNEFSLNGDLRFYLPINSAFRPFGGGGFVFLMDNEFTDFERVDDSRVHSHTSTSDPGLGFDFLVGSDFPIGKLLGTMEAKVKVGAGPVIFKISAGLTFPINVSLGRR